jgi:hypothetical protein
MEATDQQSSATTSRISFSVAVVIVPAQNDLIPMEDINTDEISGLENYLLEHYLYTTL